MFSNTGDRRGWEIFPPEAHRVLLLLHVIQLQVVFVTPSMNQSTRLLYSFSLPFSKLLTRAVSGAEILRRLVLKVRHVGTVPWGPRFGRSDVQTHNCNLTNLGLLVR